MSTFSIKATFFVFESSEFLSYSCLRLFICSFISNKLGTYHFNIKKGKITQTFKTDFISILGILLNLYLLLIIYYLLPLGVIVVIGFEVINIIGLKENFQEEKILKRKDNKKLRRKIRKKAK